VGNGAHGDRCCRANRVGDLLRKKVSGFKLGHSLKLSLDAKALPPGSGRGNLSSRLVFAGERWQSRDLCIHGQELKWHCTECEAHFKEREKPKTRKRA